MTTLIGPHGWIVDEAGEITLVASAPGVIGGAIIRAARHSASLSRGDLADMLTVDPGTVRDLENGSRPLFCMPYQQLCQLADTLHEARARVGDDKNELILASQCDRIRRSPADRLRHRGRGRRRSAPVGAGWPGPGTVPPVRADRPTPDWT